MSSKKCFTCKETLSINNFPFVYSGEYKSHRRDCFDCHRLKCRKQIKKYYNTSISKEKKKNQYLKDKFSGKTSARMKALYAVRIGKIIPPKSGLCEICNNNKFTSKHHYKGYDNPLDVQFLCRLCHNKLHFSKNND